MSAQIIFSARRTFSAKNRQKKTAPSFLERGFEIVMKGQIIFAGLAATYSPTP